MRIQNRYPGFGAEVKCENLSCASDNIAGAPTQVPRGRRTSGTGNSQDLKE